MTTITPQTRSLTVTPAGALTTFLSGPAFIYRMLVLPNGHMLLCSADSGTIWDYAPTGTPSSSWAPTISSITRNVNGSYTLTGTQLTGISQGASYGDDAEMDTNYPIVRLTASNGTVRYARTTNWTPGVATGSQLTSVQFTLPSGTIGGTYQLAVIANGIASTAKTFNSSASPGNVTASYSSGTLTLTGDVNPDSLTITFLGTSVKVEGGNGTTINGTAAQSLIRIPACLVSTPTWAMVTMRFRSLASTPQPRQSTLAPGPTKLRSP